MAASPGRDACAVGTGGMGVSRYRLMVIMALALAACGGDAATTTLAPRIQPPLTTSTAPTTVPSPTFDTSSTATTTLPSARVIEDIPYVSALHPDATETTLDVYKPEGPGPFPVVVLMHGAGMSTKGIYARFSSTLADEGFLVFTPDLSSNRAFDAQSTLRNDGIGLREDLEKHYCAALFASVHAPDYGGQPESLVVFGVSGGGHGGMWVSLVGDGIGDEWDRLAATSGGPAPQIECLAQGSLGIEAYIGFNSAMAIFEVISANDASPELMALANPRSHFGRNPHLTVVLVAGSADDVLPDELRQANREWLAELAALGYEVGSVTIDTAHEVSITNLNALVDVIRTVHGDVVP